jgi:TRAP-type C4-dicarboxylate transport system permease small subunit
MRTGIAVLALPLTVTSFLIATSKYYDIIHVLHLLIPLGVVNLTLMIFGAYLIIRAIVRMRHYDHLILEIKEKHSVIGKYMD